MRVAATVHEYCLRACAHVAHSHRGGIESARLRRNREEDGVVAWQKFWPEMVSFTMRAVGPRQHLDGASAGWNALQPRVGVDSREGDRVVCRPRRSLNNPVDVG